MSTLPTNDPPARATGSQTAARLLLGATLLFSGTTHLTVARDDFRAQVPRWIPLPVDTTVLASGVVEIALGAALVALRRQRTLVGGIAAAFFVAIFPGNISQYVERIDAFGLDTDRARFARLFFQPLLVLWALWGAGVLGRRGKDRALPGS